MLFGFDGRQSRQTDDPGMKMTDNKNQVVFYSVKRINIWV